MTASIAILGGSFNPVHLGHIRICETVLAKFPVAKCVLMPNYQSPHKWAQDLVSSEHRLRMLKLAVDEFKELGIEISTWEIDQNRISYTIHTLQHFKDAGVKTVFVIGADAFCDIASWKDYRKLFELSDFAVVNRPTHDNLQPTEMIPPTVHHFFKLDQAAAPSPDSTTFRHTSGSLLHFVPMTAFSMSSTTLRQRLRAGKDCSAFIPERALAYILEHGLYALQESSVPA